MTGPVTAQIEALFEKHGLDTRKHWGLIVDLMTMTYDEMDKGIDAVLGGQALVNRARVGGKSCARIGEGERHG